MAIIRKEINKINKATDDYLSTVMKTMKNYPKGVSKLNKNVKKMGRHMDELEKITKTKSRIQSTKAKKGSLILSFY